MFREIRAAFAHKSPIWIFVPGAIIFHALHPYRGTVTFRRADCGWKVSNVSNGQSFYLPSLRSLSVVGKDYSSDIYKKYTLDGFVEVEPSDTVIDIGAFVGAFSIAAAERGATVHAVEPSPANAYALLRNTEPYDTISVHRIGIWHENTTMEMEIGVDPTDNSFINVDSESTETRFKAEVKKLGRFCSQVSGVVDMLKVDGEGSEPEVLADIGNADIRKVAVDVSAERNDSRTETEVRSLLEDAGYVTRTVGDVIYARRTR